MFISIQQEKNDKTSELPNWIYSSSKSYSRANLNFKAGFDFVDVNSTYG